MLLKVLRLLLREDPLDRWLLSVCKKWGIQCVPTGWQLTWALAATLVCSLIYWLMCRDRGRWEVSRTCRVLNDDLHIRHHRHCRGLDLHERRNDLQR